MSKQNVSEFKPFMSVIIVIFTLFSIMFLQMEVRRMGYVVLKQGRQHKSLQDNYRLLSLEFTKYTNPARLRKMAKSRLTLSEASKGQIIQISGNNIALRQ